MSYQATIQEQRLVTFIGGPLDGRMEAWAPGQLEREVKRTHYPPPQVAYAPFQYVYGWYLGNDDAGYATWCGPSEKPESAPSDTAFWDRLRAILSGKRWSVVKDSRVAE